MSAVFPIETKARYAKYTATAGQTLFDIPFEFQQNRDVKVQKTAAAGGSPTVLTEGADYTVAGAGVYDGGSFTLVAGAAAGDTLEIWGEAVLDRKSSVVQNGIFSSKTQDDEHDRHRIIQQELKEEAGRAFKLPRGAAPLPEGHFGIANSAGEMVDGGTADQISSAQGYAEAAAQDAADAEDARQAAEAAAAGVSLPSVAANRMLVDNAAGDARESKTFQEVRDLLEVGGKYTTGMPYISVMDRLRRTGITPEDVDTGNEIGNDADAAIPFREMFTQGLGDGINFFRSRPGQDYTFASADPSGTGTEEGSIGVLVQTSSDVRLDLTGSRLLGTDDILEMANPGAMLRFEAADVLDDGTDEQILEIRGLKIDLSAATPASPGVTGIGGLALVGRWNAFLDNLFMTGGAGTPAGDDIGVGGIDQAVFGSNMAGIYIRNLITAYASDLVLYLSNSKLKRALVEGGFSYRCSRVFGLKRNSSGLLVVGHRTLECDTVAYNPTSDGLDDNMGGQFHLRDCILENTQSRPVDINAGAAGSSVIGCTIRGWGRRVYDGGENSTVDQLASIRCRSPNCIINDNDIGLGTMPLTTTSGKQQIGIEFSYNGAVTEGAEHCSFAGNAIRDVYRAVQYDANTSWNLDMGGNKRVGVSVPDTDAGANEFPIQLADDELHTMVAPRLRNHLNIKCQTVGVGAPNGDYYFNVTGSPATDDMGVERTTNMSLASNITTVGGAPDGNFTLSSNADGTITFINRTGGTKWLSVRDCQN